MQIDELYKFRESQLMTNMEIEMQSGKIQELLNDKRNYRWDHYETYNKKVNDEFWIIHLRITGKSSRNEVNDG